MSFATCCPSCDTTFRVVRDQLKVSEGWVRCGRCGEVFCALDGLFELGRDDAPVVAHPSPSPEVAAAAAQAPAEEIPFAAPLASTPPLAAPPGARAEPPVVDPPRPAPVSAPPREAPVPAAQDAGFASSEPFPAPRPETETASGFGFRDEPSARDTGEDDVLAAQEAPAFAAAAPAPGWPPAAPPPAALPEPAPSTRPLEQDRSFAPRTAASQPEDSSLLRPSRAGVAVDEEDDTATSADVLDSRFFEDEDRPDVRWPELQAHADSGDFADARFSSTLGESDFAPGDAAEPAAPAAAEPPSEPMPLESEAAQPGFLQQARRQERLSRPAVRAALATLAVMLGGVLALQIAVQQREVLAAEVPATRPWLERWCGWTGCELGPLRRIEDVVLDHSALADAGAGRPGYRLSLLLRNRGDASVALPALELTLTDTRGELVARRALLPSDFPGAQPVIAPRAQLALNIEIDTPGQRLAGYTVETFYP